MAKELKLLEPQYEMTFPLMKAIQDRRSIRKWKEDEVSLQDLSNILWAAAGQTKEATKKAKSKRTVPSGSNSQEIRLFVLMKDGVYQYDEIEHRLVQRISKDIRSITGTQKMMQSAPLGLVLVADLTRFTSTYYKNKETKQLVAWVDSGYMSQNIYLYCSAAGMSTVALGLVDRDKLSKAMDLKEHEKIVITHVVGYQQ